MNARQRLEDYLDRLRRRLRTHIYARAAAVVATGTLALTAMLVWLLQRDGFPSGLALIGRISLLLLIAITSVAFIWRPLRSLRTKDGANEFERRLPAQRGRIETYLDARRREATFAASPLVDLLAADAATLTDTTPVRSVVTDSRIGYFAGAALLAAAALVCMLIAGPSYWGHGSRYLLLGAQLPRTAVPLRQLVVSPGDVTVRRNSDLTIRASAQGFEPDKAQVFVRFDGEQRWQSAPMRLLQDDDKNLWEFRLYALRGPLRYYVVAQADRNAERSGEHTVAVVDLPRIERVRLTYEYPQWTGLPTRIEEASRDIRAVPETKVKLEVFADAALESPVVVVDGTAAALQSKGTASTGSIAVMKPGRYHIAARVANELVTLTDDYPIEILADEKPGVEIQKPGRDWRATSIEEVPVRVQAHDDFRLQQVELRYSVNGGDWQALNIGGGRKQSDTESLLRLEELGAQQPMANDNKPQSLQPGDLISYYAVAKDRSQSAQTDLFMVEVQPFERRFSQGQGGGGAGGGAGNEQGAISERQREILLATWNLQRTDQKSTRSRTQLEDAAKLLAELQTTLAAQTRTMAERMRARSSANPDERVQLFIESLERAVNVMDPAAKHLNRFDLKAAVPVEQQALQQLLRAESAFRDVQIAMQREGSGNGGEQAARNFTEMFELEMDVDKNHYETQSQLSQRNDRNEMEEATRKLKELAERQEKLAQQANRSTPQREQRWQQEQLRREAEDLQRRLAELQRSQQASTQSRSSQPESSASARQRQSADQLADALESMQQALGQMRAANDNPSDETAQRSVQEASRNLRQALERMNRPVGQGIEQTAEQLAQRTRKLADEQRRVESDLYRTLAESMESQQRRGQPESRRTQALVETKQKMAGELRGIQQQMRDAMNDHRSDSPGASQRLSEALNELENANLEYRLNRSASEIRYGRAREAAPREGLIAEALDTLERDLRAAAQIAAAEGKNQVQTGTADAMLAQIGMLRRALEQAQREGAPNQSQDPAAAKRALDVASGVEQGAAQFSRDAAGIAERIRGLATRLNNTQLTASQISALRRLTHELKYLAGDPLAAQRDAMAKLVDQIELATLAAAQKSRTATPAHTSESVVDTPQYRDAVAEYYRRLGGGCAREEETHPC